MPTIGDNQAVDALIIGHGMAGALLASSLINRGQKVLVIDQPSENSASNVAAGLINPVTGHRLNVTTDFDQYWTFAQARYHALHKLYNTQVCRPIQQYRLIKNSGQLDYFQRRKRKPNYQNYLGNYQARPSPKHPFNTDFGTYGFVEIKNSAMVNTRDLLKASKRYLLECNSYHSADFKHSHLAWHDAYIEYENIHTHRVIFCEGYRAIHNPWLNNLPFKLAKGEIVDIELEHPLDTFLNWGNWLIPDETHNFARLGASYAWNDLSFKPDQTNQLLTNLRKFTAYNGKIIGTRVGIRPTTQARIPFIGRVTSLSNSYCFNGFGSKGCLTIPYYAEMLADHIINDTPINSRYSQFL